MLVRKFGVLPDDVSREVDGLSVEQLDLLSEALLEMDGVKAFGDWLKRRMKDEFKATRLRRQD